jgi:16S rRNA (guanine527-N7)-methyltransferase
MRPEARVLMVESRPLRAEWLERARIALRLEQAVILSQQIESIETAPFRVISARAFAPLDRLLRLSARFSTADTLWLLPKGRSAQQELLSLRGWQHMFHVEQSLTDADAGLIIGTLQGRKGKNRDPHSNR